MNSINGDRGGVLVNSIADADGKLTGGAHKTVIHEVFKDRGFPLKREEH